MSIFSKLISALTNKSLHQEQQSDKEPKEVLQVIAEYYQKYMMETACRFGKGTKWAESVVQDALVSFVADPAKMEGFILYPCDDAELNRNINWLRTCVRNQALNEIKKEKRVTQKAFSIEAYEEMYEEEFALEDEAATPEEEYAAKEITDLLEIYYEKRRTAAGIEVLRLRLQQGMNNKEVAAALGISEDAASKRYNREIERLVKWLERQGIIVTTKEKELSR